MSGLQGANVILFDLHGEYSDLSYVKKIKIGDGGLGFPMWFLSLKDIYGSLLKIKEDSAQLQVAALRKAFYEARESDKTSYRPRRKKLSIANSYRNLKKLGISHSNAGILANSRKGYWRIANSPILKAALSNQRLEKDGFQFFSSYYKSVIA